MSKEEIEQGLLRLEQKLIEICLNDGVEYESDEFYLYQTGLIAGFVAAVNEVPVGLGIALMGRRPIVNNYTVKDEGEEEYKNHQN